VPPLPQQRHKKASCDLANGLKKGRFMLFRWNDISLIEKTCFASRGAKWENRKKKIFDVGTEEAEVARKFAKRNFAENGAKSLSYHQNHTFPVTLAAAETFDNDLTG
jgi:hypothetical protein